MHKLIRITTVPISLRVLLRHQLRFMSEHFDVLAVASEGKELQDVGVAEGVRTAAVNMTRAITPLNDLQALWRLYRLFKKEHPHLVHTHTPKAGLLGMMAAWMARVPVRMHTVAGLPLMEAKGRKRKLLSLVERLTYACATRVYPNSRVLAQYIAQNRFCPPRKLTVLGNGSSNGIDTAYFKKSETITAAAEALRQQLGIEESDFVFVFAGRLVRDKGLEELVAAFEMLKPHYPHLKLLLVGFFEPALDPLSAATSRAIEAQKDILVIPFQHDIRPVLAMSQALSFPSYREGFPNVPMQAGCMELPCIVTNINGCNEIVKHGLNGLVVPPKNAAALRDAMEKLMTNPSLYAKLQSNARRQITERFDQKKLWELLYKEYQEQLKAHAPEI